MNWANNYHPDMKLEHFGTVSKVEYRDFKKREKDRLFELRDEATGYALEDGRAFTDYLTALAKLNRYSVGNVLLLITQCPGVSQVRTYDEWKERNVRIRKGAKGLSVLEPCEYERSDGTKGTGYNIKKVFDVSQTDRKTSLTYITDYDPEVLIAALVDTSPAEVETGNPGEGLGAYYDPGTGKITVREQAGTGSYVFASLARESAHAEFAGKDENYTREAYDFKAVCTAYMLCRKYGIEPEGLDAGNFPAGWKEEKPEAVREELKDMRTCLNSIGKRIYEYTREPEVMEKDGEQIETPSR